MIALRGPIASVPFRFERHEIVAKAKINGRIVTVLLDTGTAPSVVDLRLADALKLKRSDVGFQGDGGGTGNQKAFELAPISIQIGALSVDRLEALATDLSGLGKKFGRKIDMVLGDSLFSGRTVQFDYRRKRARFFRSMPAPHLGSVTLPFQHENSEVHVTMVKINGQEIIANIDTGSSSVISLTPRGIKKLHLEDVVAKSKKSESTGFQGTYISRSGTVDSFEFGKYRRTVLPAGFWTPGTGHDDNPWDANVGNAFLEDYVVTIDYASNKINLSKS